MADDLDAAAGYSRWAATYDEMANATRDLDALALRRTLADLTAEHVLELGCGTGKNTIWLAERFPEVTALDFSEAMLARAEARLAGQSVRFLRHDLRRPLPLSDGAVDLVTLDLVLEHIETLEPVIDEAARVLRPGGSLFLCELHPERQRRGAQAQFHDPDTDETQLVEAYQHSVPDYLNAGLAAGLILRRCDEWSDAEATPQDPPRLFSALFAR